MNKSYVLRSKFPASEGCIGTVYNAENLFKLECTFKVFTTYKNEQIQTSNTLILIYNYLVHLTISMNKT
jgi:hypothetical protein